MSVFSRSAIRTSALALLLSTTILAGNAIAADDMSDTSGAPNSTVTMQPNGQTTTTPDTNVPGGVQTPDNSMSSGSMSNGSMAMHHDMHHDGMMKKSPAEMQAHVEDRIKMLHAKLMITKDQESAFSSVADAMRDNEKTMSSLIQGHKQNASNETAVDNLHNYSDIAQAHADGMKKVTSAFETLYNSLSATQKATADKLFSEGPMGGHHKMMHHHSQSAQ